MTAPGTDACIAHVGLPKTGSTYLQIHYLGCLDLGALYSITKPFRWPAALRCIWPANWFWYENLRRFDDVMPVDQRHRRFAAKVDACLPRWRRSVRRFAATRRPSGLTLITAEGLSGCVPEVNGLLISLLKQAGVKKLLLVCRQQADYAQSLWRQVLLAEDWLARFVPFETLFGGEEEEGVVGLDWNAYIEPMDDACGAENVLVLPCKCLKTEAPSFFRRAHRFFGFAETALLPKAGVRENPSRLDAAYRGLTWDHRFPFKYVPWVRRRLHRLLGRFPQPLPRTVHTGHSMTLPREALDRLQRRFADANAQLQQRLGIDLRAYGCR